MPTPDTVPDSPPPADDHPDSLPDRDDPRPDIQQAVEARRDAVARGEGGLEPETMTDPGMQDGVGGTGGVTRNQDVDAQ